MGLELKFEDNRGPYFDTPLNNADDVSSLTDENNSSLEYVADATIHTKEKLNNEIKKLELFLSNKNLYVEDRKKFELVSKELFIRKDMLLKAEKEWLKFEELKSYL